jgi:hypothetical protein
MVPDFTSSVAFSLSHNPSLLPRSYHLVVYSDRKPKRPSYPKHFDRSLEIDVDFEDARFS